MGTVGLSFGSPTSGQGFDVASTVAQIQAAAAAIEDPWNTQLTSLKAQDSVFTALGTDLSTLTTSLQTLTDPGGVFAEKEGSSSDTNTVALSSAASTAAAGSHTIVVTSLATTSSSVSDVVGANDVLSGTLTIQGHSFDIDSADNDTSLSSLASAINSAGIGVTASVLTDSTGSRLSIVSLTSGAIGQLSISGTLGDQTSGQSAISFTTQAGQDGSITVDGATLDVSSNTVTNAIPGVTLQLLAPSAKTAAPVQVVITNDNTDIEKAVNNFVTAYNVVVKDIAGQTGNDANGNPEPLAGTSLLSQLQSQLSTALFGGGASGSIKNIFQLGITTGNDGTLTLDSDTLDSALNSSATDVADFFQNPDSFGQSLATTLNNLGNTSPDGAVTLAQQQNAAQEQAFNSDITNENALLATQKIQLTNELNAANQILQAIPSQLNEINSVFDSITGFNPNQQ